MKHETFLLFYPVVNGKFEAMKYETITDVIADLRLIIENCYRYNGADHYVSKQAEKMEQVLDQKLALLSRYDSVTMFRYLLFEIHCLCFYISGSQCISVNRVHSGLDVSQQ